jgi:hypothetical protein
MDLVKGCIILQDLASHFYLAAGPSWVKSCQQAGVFDHTWEAILEGLKHKDNRLQLVWCFSSPSATMYIAVHAK